MRQEKTMADSQADEIVPAHNHQTGIDVLLQDVSLTETRHIQYEIDHLEHLAFELDDAFRIPLIGYRVGYDPILGLLPVAGDTISLLPSLYILYKSYCLDVSNRGLALMSMNVLTDYLCGVVPAYGLLVDPIWKANQYNIQILKKEQAGEMVGLKEFGKAAFVVMIPVIVGLLLLIVAGLFFYWQINTSF